MLVLALLLSLGAAASAAYGPSAGCGAAPFCGGFCPPGVTATQTFESGGVARTYRLRLPLGYDPAAAQPQPLLLLFHGYGDDATGLEQQTQFSPLADAQGFTVVYVNAVSMAEDPCVPPGSGGQAACRSQPTIGFNAGGASSSPGPAGETCAPATKGMCASSCAARPQACNHCDWSTCLDDVAFVRSLLETQLLSGLCVDTARVYAGGFSNGAILAYVLAAKMPEVFAAVAPLSATPHAGFMNPPLAGHSGVAVLDVHGDDDRVCPANATAGETYAIADDGWRYTTVLQAIDATWAEADGCAGGLAVAAIEIPANLDGVQCMEYKGCSVGNSSVMRCSFGGGHEVRSWWAQLAWSFLSAHAKAQSKDE